MNLLTRMFRRSGKVPKACMISPMSLPFGPGPFVFSKTKPMDAGDAADMRALITQVTDELREMLLLKNAAYGNSASDPLRVFSQCGSVEAINVRLDDKLSRLARGSNAGEDPEWDIMGYLVLKRCVVRSNEAKAKAKN